MSQNASKCHKHIEIEGRLWSESSSFDTTVQCRSTSKKLEPQWAGWTLWCRFRNRPESRRHRMAQHDITTLSCSQCNQKYQNNPTAPLVADCSMSPVVMSSRRHLVTSLPIPLAIWAPLPHGTVSQRLWLWQLGPQTNEDEHRPQFRNNTPHTPHIIHLFIQNHLIQCWSNVLRKWLGDGLPCSIVASVKMVKEVHA